MVRAERLLVSLRDFFDFLCDFDEDDVVDDDSLLFLLDLESAASFFCSARHCATAAARPPAASQMLRNCSKRGSSVERGGARATNTSVQSWVDVGRRAGSLTKLLCQSQKPRLLTITETN